MDSLFEPSYLDPLDAASSSFLSFSALDDLASPFDAILSTLGQSPAPSFSAYPSSSAPSLPSSSSSMSGTSWGLVGPSKLRSPESAHSSETDSPLPVDPLDVFIAAFEPVTPPADCGIFHDGSTGSHKLSGADSQPSYFSHRSSGSASTTESWASPVSPHAFRKGAIETPLARFANPADLLLSSSPPSGSSIPFSWDAASITLGSTSYAPPPTPTSLRVASNPTLGAAYRNPHRLKAVPSLSSLPEDKSVGLSLDEHDSSALLDDPTSAAYWTEDGLATISEGNWLSRIQAGAVPADATIYASEDVTAAQSQMNNLPLDVTEKDFDAFELAASGGYTTMAPVYNLPPSFEASSQAEGMYAVGAVPPTYAAETYERPTSNPLPEFGVQASQMSSAQNGEAMQRSMTAPFIGQPHSAPSGGLFTNAPQIYNGERIGTQKQLFNSAPLVREHLAGQGIDPRLHAAAGQHRPLQVQIHPPAHSTFVPASASVQHSHSAPLQMSTPHRRVTSFAPAMTRASTQPLPPPQQMTSVTYGQQPASYDWQTAGGVLSSMGPGLPQGVNQVQSQWSPLVPNQQLVHSTPVVQAPIVSRPAISPPARTTVHPPPHPNGPAYATGQHLDATAYAAMTASQMRVHPPPGTLSVHPQKYRPMAALPRRAATSMARSASAAATMEGASLGGGRVTSRRASVTPKKGKAAKMAPLSFDDCFVNFTPEDGAQLRAAVAPSGSASKRKREAAAAAAAADVKRRNSHAGTASPPSPSPAPAAAAPAAKKPRHQE